MSDFSFSDLGKVHWLSTLKLAIARGFATGLVFSIFALAGGNIGSAFSFPFLMAVVSLPLGLLFNLMGKIGGMLIPIAGLACLLLGSLMVCVGDPLVYFINRQWPRLLNIADLKFFNLRPLIFITYPD